MDFEYDPNKSAINLAKHGIDFRDAQDLWDGVTVTVGLGNSRGEERSAVFGMIDGKHWTAIITLRNEKIRIISVRRSRVKEAEYYDSKKGN